MSKIVDLQIASCVFCFFVLCSGSVLGQEKEIGIESISIENWKAISESVRTYEAKLKIYRVRFKPGTPFDIAGFEAAIKKAHADENIDECLESLFHEFYPTLKSPEPGLVWGETVEIAVDASRERVRWYLSDNKLTLDYLFTPNAVLRRVVKLGQIQVSNASSMERFPASHIISLPIEDPDTYEAKEDKLPLCRLESKTSEKAIEFDTETMAVNRLIKGEKYLRVNLLGTENLSIGHPVPSLFYEIQTKGGSIHRIKITRILELKINEKIDDQKLSMAIGKGETLIDIRGGVENARVYSPKENEKDAYVFLNESSQKGSASEEMKDEVDNNPATENDSGKSNTSMSRDLLRLLTIASIVFCVSLFVTREE